MIAIILNLKTIETSNLNEQYFTLREELADYLGYADDDNNWTNEEEKDMDRIMKQGIRQAYWPPIVPGQRVRHDWSWLKPVTTITTDGDVSGTASGQPAYVTVSALTATTSVFTSQMVGRSVKFTTSSNSYVIDAFTSGTIVDLVGDASGETSGDTFSILDNGIYDLPLTFGQMYGPMTYATNVGAPAIRIVGEAMIRREEQYTDSSGKPVMAAMRPKAPFDYTDGQRMQIMFHPIPDAAYVLTYQYMILPSNLSSRDIFPLGGVMNTDLIRLSIMSIAEQEFNKERGLMYTRFIEFLAAAVSTDKEAIAPEWLGSMNDVTDRNSSRFRFMGQHIVTYNGIAR